jgi:ABC-2 type transport system ATP-binding protein
VPCSVFGTLAHIVAGGGETDQTMRDSRVGTEPPPEVLDDRSGGSSAVVTDGLTKRFGDRVAVDGIEIELPAGVVSGFVGPNGAGKTTTIQMLLGLMRPTSGSAQVLGHSIGDPAGYLARVGALIEAPSFYPTLSGRRNLEVLTRLGRLDPSRIAEVLELVELSDRAGDLVRSYSLGMKQRLGVAAALLPNPELMILDEPTNGLDPAGIREIRALLRSLADGGMTVFVSSHLLAEIEAICDHLVMIDKGRIAFQGSISELLAAQHSELLAVPENDDDLAALVALCVTAGYPARVDGESVRVQAAGDWAAELNRRAMTAGIALRGLQTSRASLEEAFFAITDRADESKGPGD